MESRALLHLPRDPLAQKCSCKGEKSVSPPCSLLSRGAGWEEGQGRAVFQSLGQVFWARPGADGLTSQPHHWADLDLDEGSGWGGEAEDEDRQRKNERGPGTQQPETPPLSPTLGISVILTNESCECFSGDKVVTTLSPTPGAAGSGDSCGGWAVSGWRIPGSKS